MFDTLKEEFLSSLQPDFFTFTEIIIAIGLSLIASVAIYVVYQLFYASKNIGAGVDRTFIIAGPAITAMFMGIQTSLPLALGLLGALSFVRFRTPVKDPAEIGYLLVLIATSIGAATQAYIIAVVLFVAVLIALCLQWYIREGFSFPTRTNFMISVDKEVFKDIELQLIQFIESRLENLELKTISVLDNRVSMHYQHKKMSASDKADFVSELNKLAEPGDIHCFMG